jgi:hypothetical protein
MTYDGMHSSRCFHVPSAWWKGADLDMAGRQERMAEAMAPLVAVIRQRSALQPWRAHLVDLAPGVHRQAGADRTAGHGAEPPRRCRCRAATSSAWKKRPSGCASCLKPTAAWSSWCWSSWRAGEDRAVAGDLEGAGQGQARSGRSAQRYSRAITCVANALNGGKRQGSVSTPNDGTQQIKGERHPA